MKYIACLFLALALFFSACQNQDWEFPDFDYQTVYFAHQYPVRTITLGEDIFDTSLDNEWKFKIMATTGGVYENERDITIGVEVDNELVQGLVFAGTGQEVRAMPSSYYTLAANQIVIPKGQLIGGVEVQLTEAFFADSLAVGNAYVIPVKMTGVQNADSILSGVPMSAEANRVLPGDWAVQPKDFVFYAVKFINPWHANYLRRGKDDVVKDGVPSTVERRGTYVENDQVVKLTALSLNDLQFPMDFQSKGGLNLGVKVKLSFDEDQTCTIAPEASSYQVNDSVRVYNVTASGTGEFVEKGEKKSWGNKDRDALYLQYEVSYEVEIQFPTEGLPDDIEQVVYSTVDTLVVRDRGVKMEVFTPVQE